MCGVGQMTVLIWILASYIALAAGKGPHPRNVCLTGLAENWQRWVDQEGMFTNNINQREALDLSTLPNISSSTVSRIYSNEDREASSDPIRYLSLARCKLTRIPPIFDSFEDSQGRNLSTTVEYVTLFGNMFVDVSVPGEQYDVTLSAYQAAEISPGSIQRGQVRSLWSVGFQRVHFPRLRELDLRSCGISTLDSFIFQNMPELEALYLSDNSLHTITPSAFVGLSKLRHLDLSRNFATERDGVGKVLVLDNDSFLGLENLTTLDFSNTFVSFRRISSISSLGFNVEMMSLCHTGIRELPTGFFGNISLTSLDVSGNHGVLSNAGTLNGLESSLRVLFATEVGLENFDIFENFTNLEILRLANNEINVIKHKPASSLVSLQALDLRRNRLMNWFSNTYSYMPSLKFLDVRNNMITLISSDMIRDLANVSFLALSENAVFCNCYSREFIEIGIRNEVRLPVVYLSPQAPQDNQTNRNFAYYSAFDEINARISNRRNATMNKKKKGGKDEIEILSLGNFLLLDFSKGSYMCTNVAEGKQKLNFAEVNGCLERYQGNLPPGLRSGRTQLLALIAIPGVLLPAILIGFIFRRNLRYCYVTMRNSALLSMVNKAKVIDDDTSFNYDVFVSYCNEDRPWVLDHLLGHLERECSVSLCLHERDFQVGLSILENIVSCMDRSKAIMLVISQKFLLSQWCQFEMHLAQHRLLETRREDLILILLEDIPRRLRPNTLHYLMLTKTYIVWPKNKAEQHLFWKRLKKSVTTQKHKHDRVSLA